MSNENTLKQLQKEETKIYNALDKLATKHLNAKETRQFFKLLSEYVDVQVELERCCNA